MKKILLIIALFLSIFSVNAQQPLLGLDDATILSTLDNNYFEYGYTKDSIYYLSTVIEEIATIYYFNEYKICILIIEEPLTSGAYNKRIKYLDNKYDKGSGKELSWVTTIQATSVLIILDEKYFIYKFIK
jgi:hypothetical protein